MGHDVLQPHSRTDRAMIAEDLRDMILAMPEALLRDRAVMAALVAASERDLGPNVVDLRGIAMDRIEDQLNRLEDTHRSVVAAVYDNIAGTNQVHRAILQLLTPTTFPAFLESLGGEVARTLRVDCARLVIETRKGDGAASGLADTLHVTGPGFVDGYLARTDAGTGRSAAPRAVTLRHVPADGPLPYGSVADPIRSEALLRLDFGKGGLPGLLALGASDPYRFKPGQGTDLLAFFGGVFERTMRRWLA